MEDDGIRIPPAAGERAMQVREVMARAMSGEITWIQAAEICGMSPRSLRRWKLRYEARGYDGLWDRRRQSPSPRQAPFLEVQRILRLYRERYLDFNVRHFHEIAAREHGLKLSYSFVKAALQKAGLVRKSRARGKHRRRREPRPSYGEMLHIDGSKHAWLARVPEEQQTLIAIVDDATSELLYAQLCPEETTRSILAGLWEVLVAQGIPQALYSDRASWAAFTPRAGGPVDPSKPTHVGRVLTRLGIEQIVCLKEPRVVAKDNTVVFHKLIFQIDKQPGRRSCERARVLVREHRDGTHSIWLGPQWLGLYDAQGRPLSPHNGNKPKCSRLPRLPDPKADRSFVKIERSTHLLTTCLFSSCVCSSLDRGRAGIGWCRPKRAAPRQHAASSPRAAPRCPASRRCVRRARCFVRTLRRSIRGPSCAAARVLEREGLQTGCARMSPLVGTPVPAVTRTCSTWATWLQEVPRI